MMTVKPFSLMACLLAGSLAWAAPAARAAGLQVSPVSLFLPASQQAAVLTLTNTGGEPLTAQVRVFRWTQNEQGQDVYTPDSGVVASPPMLRMAAGAEQQLRLIRTGAPSAEEAAYRIVIDELPPPQHTPRAGLNFVLRYSLPLFLNQSENPPARLHWQWRAVGGKTELSARNTGASYAQLGRIALTAADGKETRPLADGLTGYVLPGSTWRRVFDVSPAQVRQGGLSVKVNDRIEQPEVGFAAP
ncbi:MAG: molecular chaperone [Eikenella sp.]|nr:molecular chaperone [Eikenella sp.]